MMKDFRQALVTGVERLSAWADILDKINVFPIADGDTGRNLVISLAPLRRHDRDVQSLSHDLLLSARGNSGNIACGFFQYFIHASSRKDMCNAVRLGCDAAWQAVHDPHPGTMLSFFDALAAALSDGDASFNNNEIAAILTHLEAAVRNTISQQPKLQRAGVVDAGALGMFLYFEGFFHVLTGCRIPLRDVTETFRNGIQVSPSYGDEPEAGYCVDTVLHSGANAGEAAQVLASSLECVVVTRQDAYLKVHFHTRDREDARRRLAHLGRVIDWAEDDLYQQMSLFVESVREPVIHIMTDAAGSITRHEAKTLGMSLLDSYIVIGERSLPETYFGPEELYDAMRSGTRVSTAQSSVFERHQFYASVMSRHRTVLYLCVGSVFTGNYNVVMDWKREHDPEDHLKVIDTGTASGRLGVIALAVADYAFKANNSEKVIEFSRQAVARSEEYIFLDCLEYVAAGGRLSTTGAFVGDMLSMKPIVSPMAEGARRVGVVRNRKDQLRFALEALGRALQPQDNALIMLEYSDNLPWVDEVRCEVTRRYPQAQIIVHPLSLTSGAHMGPGTWAVAFLPGIQMP
jgi:uncharacterized protein